MEVLIELEREKDNSFIERETERERETEPKAKMAQLLTNSIFHLGVKDNKTVATKRTPPQRFVDNLAMNKSKNNTNFN